MRENIAHPFACLPISLETEGRREQAVLGIPQRLAVNNLRALPDEIGDLRLVIKRIHLRRPARHEELNHVLGLGRKVRRLGREWRDLSGGGALVKQPGEAKAAKARTDAVQGVTPRNRREWIAVKLHRLKRLNECT